MIKEGFITSVVMPVFKEGKIIQKVIMDIKNSLSYRTRIIVVCGHLMTETKRW